MRLHLSFLLLFSLGLLAVSGRPAPPPNPFTLSVEKVTAPFKNVIEGARNDMNDHIEQFKTLVNWQTSAQGADNQEPATLKLDVVNVNDVEESDEEIDQEILDESDNGRVLASSNPCKHGGIPRATLVNIYTCNNKIVTQTQYQARGGIGCQVQTNVTRNLCYCSYEFYGSLCQNFNPWVCQLERLNYPDQCRGVDSFDYVYSMDGIPPCYPVKDGQNITLSTKLICQSADSTWDYEGAKPAKYQVVEQPRVRPNLFNYVIESDKLKLTFTPSQFKQQIIFTNWRLMSQPYIIETTLNNSEIIGNSPINTEVSFIKPLTDFAAYGRYYYEIIIRGGNMNDMNTTLTSNYYYGGYFEEAGYVEPSAPNKINKPLVICLSIFGALLLIGAFFAYRKFKNKKAMEIYQIRANQLYGDDRQE